MNQTSTVLVVCGVVALVVLTLAALFGFLAVGTSGSFSSEPIRMRQPPDDGSTGVVYDIHKEGPDVVLWSWQIISPRYTAVVGFIAPEGCDSTKAISSFVADPAWTYPQRARLGPVAARGCRTDSGSWWSRFPSISGVLTSCA
jgi:hypothetical protein